MENNQRKISFFELGVLFLGVFCVLAGFGSVIASNWQLIPAAVKLVGSLALLGVGLFGIYYFYEKQQNLGIELSIFYSFLMIGANIALIQQLYHLSIGFSVGSLMWAVLSSGFLLITKKRLVPVLWTILLVFGLYDVLIDLWRFLSKYFDFLGYRGIAALFFIGFLLTYFSAKEGAKVIRNGFIFMAGFVMLVGDTFLGAPFFETVSVDASSPIGILLTVALLAPVVFGADNIEPKKYFNLILTYVALQIVLLFWAARLELAKTGVCLIVFGILIWVIAAVHAKWITPREKNHVRDIKKQ